MQQQQNSALYHQLKQAFKKFVYHSYNYTIVGQNIQVQIHFQLIDTENQTIDLFAKSEYHFPDSVAVANHYKQADLDNLVFHIGMAELVSYWKLACPLQVEILPFQLSQEQMDWWVDLYYLGLQEFFYVNGIPSPDKAAFMQIQTISDKVLPTFTFEAVADRNIIPIGGGKDSAVTLHAKTTLGTDNYTLIINPRGASLKTHEVAGLAPERLVTIQRTIDKTLLELNANGFANGLAALNGHTPFSATLAYYSLVASYFTGAKNIVLSNESSADEPTVVDTIINHQYSKSFEFEQNFRSYVQQYISPSFNYYSFLRPLNELQIAGLFSTEPAYFKDFRSCNVGSKQNIWCNNCAKCLFTFIILSPFIEPKQLEQIFGENLLNKKSLQIEFDELIGVEEVKPFECVGTVDEVNAALAMAIDKYYNEDYLPWLLNYFVEELDSDIDTYLDSGLAHLNSFAMEHNLTVQDMLYLQAKITKLMTDKAV